MLPNTLAELLKLSASDRVEIAMALWESLSETERTEQLPLAAEQEAELDRRLAEHIAIGLTRNQPPSKASQQIV
jgi:putative addiction module component (TIGR02574 family)